MMVVYRARLIPEVVEVYRHLPGGKWSVRAGEGPNKGLVVAHADELTLSDCTYHVSEAGRRRAIRDGQRNVHAFVRGRLRADGPRMARVQLEYDYEDCGEFTIGGGEFAMIASAEAYFSADGKAYTS